MKPVNFQGQTNIPSACSFFIPNKINLDALLDIEKELGADKICYLVEESFPPPKDIAKHLHVKDSDGILFKFGSTDPISMRRTLLDKMASGRHIVFLPGPVASRKGSMAHIPEVFLYSLSTLHISPVPIFVGFYREVMFEAEGDELSHDFIEIRVLQKLKPGPEAGSRIMESWMEASAECFASLKQFDRSLAAYLVERLKAYPNGRIIDGIDDSVLLYSRLLPAAIAFSKHLKTLTRNKRVGIILPPGKGATVANLACVIAGITPVNMNYSSSESSFKSAVRQSGVDRFISADAFMRKLQHFPWPPTRDIIFMERELVTIQKSIKKWFLLTKILPTKALLKMLHLEEMAKGDDECTLLFTSGSAGEPKGVALTHRNILGNISQCSSRIALEGHCRILASLPVFHSFGMLIGLWYPLTIGYDMVTYPSPLETKRLTELISQYKTALILSTPTFSRGFLKRANKEDFSHVRYFVSGAEKLSNDFEQEFKDHFGFSMLEGYGLTEASPVCSANLPNVEPLPGSQYIIPSHKVGTVGVALPGLAVRITDPHTDARLPMSHQGMIWLKGINIFHGYIGHPEMNEELFKDGWFKTGDIGSVDNSGFITIGGRMTRFSKIGGEMIPHEALEQAIVKALRIDPDDPERKIVIVAVPDARKGEASVLLSTLAGEYLHQELIALNHQLIAMKIPALWCPREIIPVEAIPTLPSGKLDISNCRLLAYEALKLPLP